MKDIDNRHNKFNPSPATGTAGCGANITENKHMKQKLSRAAARTTSKRGRCSMNKQSGRRTIEVRYPNADGTILKIDRRLKNLLSQLWQSGISTPVCCENADKEDDMRVWIALFPDEVQKFTQMIFWERNDLYHEWLFGDYPECPWAWNIVQADINCETTDKDEKYSGAPQLHTIVEVRFPIEDIDRIIAAIEKHNFVKTVEENIAGNEADSGQSLPAVADKPCHALKYCPYGILIEEFDLAEDIEDQKQVCKVFGHVCPGFVVAHGIPEQV